MSQSNFKRVTLGPILSEKPLTKSSRDKMKEIFRAEIQREKRANPTKHYITDGPMPRRSEP